MAKSKDKPFQYPKGLRLNAEETTFIEGALMGVAEHAKKDGDPKMFNLAMGLAQRVRQAEMAHEGVPPDLQERLQKGLNKAVQSKKPELAQRAMQNFLATMVRLHPDPARALSVYVVNYVNQAVMAAIEPAQVESAQESACQILERWRIKLEGLIETYEYGDEEYPDADVVLAYLTEWNAVGLKAVESGEEPWQGDEHLAAALAAADTGDEPESED